MKISPEKLAAFEKACRKADLKVTHQRLEIFRELAESNDHPSAETIYKRLLRKLPTISFDTIYRTLATFEKHGLVTRVETIESQARFEAKMEKHHHAVCSKCGKITDFTWDIFDECALPQPISTWGSINKRNVTLQGICSDCTSLQK